MKIRKAILFLPLLLALFIAGTTGFFADTVLIAQANDQTVAASEDIIHGPEIKNIIIKLKDDRDAVAIRDSYFATNNASGIVAYNHGLAYLRSQTKAYYKDLRQTFARKHALLYQKGIYKIDTGFSSPYIVIDLVHIGITDHYSTSAAILSANPGVKKIVEDPMVDGPDTIYLSLKAPAVIAEQNEQVAVKGMDDYIKTINADKQYYSNGKVIDGSGIKVGIFEEELVQASLLPNVPVTVEAHNDLLSDKYNYHATGVAQIINKIAPGASIYSTDFINTDTYGCKHTSADNCRLHDLFERSGCNVNCAHDANANCGIYQKDGKNCKQGCLHRKGDLCDVYEYLDIKCFNQDSPYRIGIEQGLQRLADQNVNTVNMSFGFTIAEYNGIPVNDRRVSYIEKVFNEFFKTNHMIAVAAAGNENLKDYASEAILDDDGNIMIGSNLAQKTKRYVTAPASCQNVFAVGTTDMDGKILGLSSYNTANAGFRKPDIVGPSNVRIDGNPLHGPGTSFAAPGVTAAVARLLELEPSLIPYPEKVYALLSATADHNIVQIETANEASSRYTARTGAGMLNVEGLLNAVGSPDKNIAQFQFLQTDAGEKTVARFALNAGETVDIAAFWYSHNQNIYTDYDMFLYKEGDSQTVAKSCFGRETKNGSNTGYTTDRQINKEKLRYTVPDGQGGNYTIKIALKIYEDLDTDRTMVQTAYNGPSGGDRGAVAWYKYTVDLYHFIRNADNRGLSSLQVASALDAVDIVSKKTGSAVEKTSSSLDLSGKKHLYDSIEIEEGFSLSINALDRTYVSISKLLNHSEHSEYEESGQNWKQSESYTEEGIYLVRYYSYYVQFGADSNKDRIVRIENQIEIRIFNYNISAGIPKVIFSQLAKNPYYFKPDKSGIYVIESYDMHADIMLYKQDGTTAGHKETIRAGGIGKRIIVNIPLPFEQYKIVVVHTSEEFTPFEIFVREMQVPEIELSLYLGGENYDNHVEIQNGYKVFNGTRSLSWKYDTFVTAKDMNTGEFLRRGHVLEIGYHRIELYYYCNGTKISVTYQVRILPNGNYCLILPDQSNDMYDYFSSIFSGSSFLRTMVTNYGNGNDVLSEIVSDYDAFVIMDNAIDVHSIAIQNPDKKFLVFGAGENELENVSEIVPDLDQLYFLTGIAAALQTETGKVGYVPQGEYLVPQDYFYYSAYVKGVDYANQHFATSAEVIPMDYLEQNYGIQLRVYLQILTQEGCDVVSTVYDSENYDWISYEFDFLKCISFQRFFDIGDEKQFAYMAVNYFEIAQKFFNSVDEGSFVGGISKAGFDTDSLSFMLRDGNENQQLINEIIAMLREGSICLD